MLLARVDHAQFGMQQLRAQARPAPGRGEDAPTKGLLTLADAARRLGVFRRWLREHAHELPGVRRLSPKVIRLDARSLDRWLARER